VRFLSPLLPGPRPAGGLLCAAGLALIVLPARFAPALGVELLAAGFWWWARASDEPAFQVPRWSWLRRPATALWLAAAIEMAMPGPATGFPVPPATLAFWSRVEAIAIVWAALELLAALPLARPFSDLPGPLIVHGAWLPALLPAAGFLLLWRQAPRWLDVDEVREVAAALLLLTAALAALRAYGRRRWTAGLRWLVVFDSALAGVLLSSGAVPPWIAVVLWIGACGTHAWLLAAELVGATSRRGPVMAMLWRMTSWISTAALGWPLLTAAGDLSPPRAALTLVCGGIPIALASWVNVARLVEAPERRAFTRPIAWLTPSRMAPAVLLGGVPLALASAWWVGFAPKPLFALLALVPAFLGGALGLLAVHPAQAGRGARAGRIAQHAARRLFRLVIGLERALVSGVARLVRMLATPLRDLHTGDAQEYVLFLVGVAVLAILLPLLR
jgi:hypothetical protein